MSRIGYDISVAVGMLLIAGGVGAKFDIATACIVAGGLVIGLTFSAVLLTGKR